MSQFKIDEDLLTAANPVSDRTGKGSQLLSDGVYGFAVTKEVVGQSKAGQAKIMLELSPCTNPGDAATANPDAAMYLDVMLPVLQDQKAWQKTFSEKIEKNEKLQEEYGHLDLVDGAAAFWKFTATELNQYKGKVVNYARVLFGEEVTGSYSKETKTFTRNGKATTAGDIVRSSLQAFYNVAEGADTLIGRTGYMKVSEGEFNGKPQANVHYITNKPAE